MTVVLFVTIECTRPVPYWSCPVRVFAAGKSKHNRQAYTVLLTRTILGLADGDDDVSCDLAGLLSMVR